MPNFLVTLLSSLVLFVGCGRSNEGSLPSNSLWGLSDHPCDFIHVAVEKSKPEFATFEQALRAYLAKQSWSTPAGARTVVTLTLLETINKRPAQSQCEGLYMGEVRITGPFLFVDVYEFRAKLKENGIVEFEKFLTGVTSN